MLYDDIFLFKTYLIAQNVEKSKIYYEKVKDNKELQKRLNLEQLICRHGIYLKQNFKATLPYLQK